MPPDEIVGAKDRVAVGVGFLAVELGDKTDPKLANVTPKTCWAGLDPKGDKVYARWSEGDGLPSGKLLIVREQLEYRKMRVGDSVEDGQLLAIMDETIASHDLSSKIAKLEAVEAEYQEAIKTKEEAKRRS